MSYQSGSKVKSEHFGRVYQTFLRLNHPIRQLPSIREISYPKQSQENKNDTHRSRRGRKYRADDSLCDGGSRTNSACFGETR